MMNLFKKLFGRKKFKEDEKNLTKKPIDETIAPTQFVNIDKHGPIAEDAIKKDFEEIKPIEEELIRKEPKKEPVKPKEKVEENKEPDYYVSQNKSKKSQYYEKWGIKKDGSTKTIKYFDTKAEALEYAKELAESAGSKVISP
ncbi:MAG: DUF2188 domain-containing protein [Tenericutes bacterium]|jgi:hypothetical protein|nr:DUF2188 domain-containing protein [Mycoplasmatota bacterium]